MNCIVYIQIKPLEQISFGNPLSSWIKAIKPETMMLDADNHSDNLVIDHEIELLSSAGSVALILDVMPETQPGLTVRLLEKLLRKKILALIVLQKGSNQTIDNMLKLSKIQPEQFTDLETLQIKLAGFPEP